ncbi:Bax inhibitor-1/YccA family protein [Gleimia europaea]|uniref:Bax inhibitor-1/YccA family protein n=1 Tax=Gleimia europaea TaxID=66228 RepID=UPI002786F25B|nr:Bax inhibitor-1/YccA family protein [Gleimia europaea]MDP9834052.1 putative YccA/Bax inhibitor family protein [Gleimia europaea]
MSSNPVMVELDREISKTPAGYPTMPGYEPGRPGMQDAGSSRFDPHATAHRPQETAPGTAPMDQFEDAYRAPAADAVNTGRMTYDDVIVKTGSMFALVLLGAVVAWFGIRMSPSLAVPLVFGGMIASLILAMVNIFSKTIRPGLIAAYAVAEGLMLGAFSLLFEFLYPGIVLQAVIATFVVIGVALVLFASGKVRYTSRTNRFVLIVLLSVLGYNLVNMVLVWTGAITTPFGLGSITVLGIPLGVIVGGLAIVIGTYSLIGDFDVAKRGVEAGVPAVFAWRVAFGITVTAVWIYVEVLRLLAILRSAAGD